MKTLILGMGNPILSDDGVGLFIARKLQGRLKGVDVVTTAMVGLNMLDLIIGYEKIFLIDASIAKGKRLGQLTKFGEEGATLHLFSSHGVDFFGLLKLGKVLGCKMPQVAGIYGIEIGDAVSFGQELSPELKEKTESITEKIIEDIRSSL
jgi:hydrogenase maturation protease